MQIYLFVLFFIVAVLAFTEDLMTKRQKLTVLLGLCIVMIFLAATKDVETVADADAYGDLFYNNDDPLIELATEPTFIYLSRFIISIGGAFALVFLFYALVTIPLKLTMLYKMTPLVFTAMLIYVPVYYELHDLVQIRAGAAGAFLLCSLYFFTDKRYVLCGVMVAIAISFHYSSAIFIPLYFMGNKPMGKIWRLVLASAIPIGFAMYFLHLDLFSFLPSSIAGGKMDYYQASAETGTWDELTVPYKNIFFLTKCAVLCVGLYFYDYIKDESRYITIFLKAEAASIFMYLSVATIPVFASRTSDLFGIIDPWLFASMAFLVRPRYIARIGIFLVGLYMMVYNMLVAHYFDPQ